MQLKTNLESKEIQLEKKQNMLLGKMEEGEVKKKKFELERERKMEEERYKNKQKQVEI